MPFDNKTMSVVRRVRPEIGTGASLPKHESDNADLAEIVSSLSVAEVIELVESGQAELDDVIAAERVGKARKTVLSLVQSESGKVYPVSKTDRSDSVTDSSQNPFA